MRRLVLSGCTALIALASATVARADDGPNVSAATARICAQIADAKPPPRDVPSVGEMAALKGCDAEALYFGIGRAADPEAARRCAFTQQHDDVQDVPANSIFAGDVMLTMIYANGVGARRDLRYATHLACELNGAVAEQDGRVGNLAKKAASHWSGRDFSFCDDVTSGVAAGFCEAHQTRITAVARDARIDRFANGLHGDAVERFAALRRAQAAWSQARAGNEIDASGTMRGAFALEEEGLQNTDFLEMIERLRTGKPPRLGTADLRAANARLDETYRRLLAAPPNVVSNWGSVTPDGIRTAQTAWTAYRDAWGSFAAAAYPAWGSDGAEAWVTLKRADMLAAFLKP